MAHSLALWCCSAGDVRYDSFRIFRVANVVCSVFFGRTSDLSDQNDGVCARIISEEFENVNEVQSGEWVTAYAEAGGLAYPIVC